MVPILYVCRVATRMIRMMGKLCTSIESHFCRDVLTVCYFFSIYTGTGDHYLILIVFPLTDSCSVPRFRWTKGFFFGQLMLVTCLFVVSYFLSFW